MTRLQHVVHVTQFGECFSCLLEEMVTGHSLPLLFVQNYREVLYKNEQVVHLLFENVNMKRLQYKIRSYNRSCIEQCVLGRSSMAAQVNQVAPWSGAFFNSF
jgi:hypothetical protein